MSLPLLFKLRAALFMFTLPPTHTAKNANRFAGIIASFPWRAVVFAPFIPLATLWADPPATRHTLAYYEDDGGASSASLAARSANLDQLAFDTYIVAGNGVVTGRTFLSDLKLARSKQIETFATVSNFGKSDFSPKIAHSIVRSAKYTQNVIVGMLHKLSLGHYQGINIDFEGVPTADRTAFTTFVRKVSIRMHAKGYLVILSAPAKLNDDPPDSWTGAFDFGALGSAVDMLQLMTYDENGSWGDPGPVAGLDWVEAAVQYSVSVVPSAKISLGIPAYGYDWDLTDNAANGQIAWNAIAPLIANGSATPQWDSTSSSPYFTYSVSGHDHIVWYENAASIAAKGTLVNRYNLAGASVFALGMEDDVFWQALHSSGF